MMLRRLRRDESGQILAIAVAFLALFGLAAVSTLGWSTASLRLAGATGQRLNRVYTADAGTDYAIEMLRRNPELGVDGVLSCYGSPSSSGTFSLPPLNGIASSGGTVSYQARPNSGTCLPGAGNANNTPPYSVFTNCRPGGTPACDPARTTGALDLTGNNNPLTPSIFNVKGDMYSAGQLKLNQSSQLATRPADPTHLGSVRTHNGGACPSGITVLAPAVANCNLGGTFDSTPAFRLPDASQTSDLEDDPATMDLQDPAGTVVNGTVTEFEPGRYVDPPVTNQARLYVFDPGVYYFDFSSDGSPTDSSCATTPANCTWTAGTPGSSLVGGSLVDPTYVDPASVKPAPLAAQFPGFCDVAQSGVEFVFGGSSRLVVGAVNGFELCPIIPQPDAQNIAVYGVHNLSGLPLDDPTFNPQGDLMSPGADKYSPTLDTNISGNWKDSQKAYTFKRKEAKLETSGTGTFTHQWSGYTEGDIPAGVQITRIVAYPSHKESGNSNYSLSIQASVTVGGSTRDSPVVTIPNNFSGTLRSDTLSLSIPSTLPSWSDDTANRSQIKIKVSVTKTVTNKTTFKLDWIPVTIFYNTGIGPDELVPTLDLDAPTVNTTVVAAGCSTKSWGTPDKAYAFGGGEAIQDSDEIGTDCRDWSGYSSELVIPSGARIVKVTAYPRHYEETDVNLIYSLSAQAFVTGGDGVTYQSSVVTVPNNRSTTHTFVQEGKDRQPPIDMPLTSVAPWKDDSANASQIRVRFMDTKQNKKPFKLHLDWLPVTVTYRLPWRPAAGCVVADTCALLDMSNAAANDFLQGTFYAPQGRVTARTPVGGQPVFARGVIASSAQFLMTAARSSSDITTVPPSVGLNVAGREVSITVDVGTSKVTALVGFDSFTQLPTVRSWYVT